jgi:putative flippase GtrA
MIPDCSTSLFIRWIRFNAVGILGVGVQLVVLIVLATGVGINYLVATAAAVEAAVLHNFVWHERYTWRDRTRPHDEALPGVLQRLIRFHLTNGLLSVTANVLLMRLLAGLVHLPLLLANLLSIAVCSLGNFGMSHCLVFRQPSALEM